MCKDCARRRVRATVVYVNINQMCLPDCQTCMNMHGMCRPDCLNCMKIYELWSPDYWSCVNVQILQARQRGRTEYVILLRYGKGIRPDEKVVGTSVSPWSPASSGKMIKYKDMHTFTKRAYLVCSDTLPAQNLPAENVIMFPMNAKSSA